MSNASPIKTPKIPRVMVATRIAPAIKDRIDDEADAEGVAFSDMHRQLLDEALAARARKAERAAKKAAVG